MGSNQPVKIILVSGGVMSGIGKGIISSSIGLLLKLHGFRVTTIKIDPYLNIDAGTFSPFEHGEVFVLDDGGEVDLDLGNYERFLEVRLNRDNNITTGKIFKLVSERERKGHYLGKTVQMVPHITDAIIEWVERVAKIPVDGSGLTPEVCIVELGGTVGDIESSPYALAFGRTFDRRTNWNRFMSIHVTKLFDEETGETKTKPTQHGLARLRESGLTPHLLICRSKRPVNGNLKIKIANFSNLEPKNIIIVHNSSNLYKVPLILHNQNVLSSICEQFQLSLPSNVQNVILSDLSLIHNMHKLKELCQGVDDLFSQSAGNPIRIAFIAKYLKDEYLKDEYHLSVRNEHIFMDAYASVVKALDHAAYKLRCSIQIKFIYSEHLESLPPKCVKGECEKTGCKLCRNHKAAWALLKDSHCVLVPGGFGDRGIEGKIEACRYARQNKVPFLGICLGFQCASIEVARNVCGIKGAHSTEFSRELSPEQQVIIDMPEHAPVPEERGMGATMRLGSRKTIFLAENSCLRRLYDGKKIISERHRHRYELNPAMAKKLSESGLLVTAMGLDALSHNKEQDENNQLNSELLKSVESRPAKSTAELISIIDDLSFRYKNSERNLAFRMEVLEMDPNVHPYFVGVQYHPEFLSHPLKPSPPFYGLVEAARERAKSSEGNAKLNTVFESVDRPSSVSKKLGNKDRFPNTSGWNEADINNHLLFDTECSDINNHSLFNADC